MKLTDPTVNGPLPSDKQTLLDDLAERAKAAHQEAEQLSVRALQKRIEVGDLLQQAKDAVDHGQFMKWVKANCSFKKRQAQRYLEVARLAKAVGLNATLGTHSDKAQKSLKQAISYLKSLDPNYQPRRRKTPARAPNPAKEATSTALAPVTHAVSASPSSPPTYPTMASPVPPSVEPPAKFAAIRVAEEKIRAAYEAVERVMKINQTELAAEAAQLRARRGRGVDAAFDGLLTPTCDEIDRLAAALAEGQAFVDMLRAALGTTMETYRHDDRRIA